MSRATVRSEAAPRVKFEQPVSLTWEGQPHLEALALNLSCDGIFVRSELAESVPPALGLRFQLSGLGPIEARAALVRVAGGSDTSEPRGVALRFEALSAVCSERLRAFIGGRREPTAVEPLRLEHSEEHCDPVLTTAFAEHAQGREAYQAAPRAIGEAK